MSPNNSSFVAVREFAENMIGTPPDISLKRVTVLVEGSANYCYRNIRMSITYNYGYMDYQVSLLWEDDADQPDYKSLDLHGYYSTNFQNFVFSNGTLTFTDGANRVTIML